MKSQKLKQIKFAIEDFFYKIKFNIALHKAFQSERYKEFQDKLKTALRKQSFHYATVEKVVYILGIEKKNSKQVNQDSLRNNLEGIWVPIFDLIERDEVASYLKDVADTSGKFALGKLKLKDDFELTNKRLLSLIDKRVDQMFKEIDSTTKAWMVRTISEAYVRGMSYIQIAKLIRKKAAEFILMRAEIIAENEAALILGEIELEVFKRNGIQFVKWVTSRDEKVCPRCNANESAGEVPVGTKFPTGVTTTPDHIRCRCFLLPTIPLELKTKWTGT